MTGPGNRLKLENTTGKRPKNNKIHEFDRQNP